jgi:hypothetical protein
MPSHAELVGLVERLMTGVEDDEAERLLDQLRELLPHPALAELIYWPEQVPEFPFAEPTAEQVVAFAMAYQPRRLSEVELAGVLGRLVGQEEGTPPSREDLYRLEDTWPKLDWASAIAWARVQKWSGAELAARICSGGLEGDPDYQCWLVQVSEAEME